MIKISIREKSELIPQVINGCSANGMFYFIHHDKVANLKNNGNTSFPDIPWDLDDFGRCVLAANALCYGETEIKKGLEIVKTLKYPKKFVFLFENFLVMKKEYENGNLETVKNFIKELREVENEK